MTLMSCAEPGSRLLIRDTKMRMETNRASGAREAVEAVMRA
jgi:hypothetical protein